jgi:integrase
VTRRRQQEGYVYKRNGFWVVRFRIRTCVNGQVRTVQRAKQIARVDATHKTKASVNAEVVKALAPFHQHAHAPEVVTTLGDFVERVYLPHVAGQKRASTFQGYRNKWRLYFRDDQCSKWWLRDIRTCHIQHLLERIAQEHDLSRTTLRHLKALLSGILNYAKQQDYFDGVNPVVGSAIPKARVSGDTCAYSLEQVASMVRLLPEPVATLVATAAFTGLRRGELRGLCWEDYDGEELRVSRSMWNSIADEPKTRNSKAPVPVISRLRAMLDAHWLAAGNQVSGPMFTNSLGKPACLNNVANRTIIPVLKGAGIEWRGWHAFRRGLATNLNRLGVSGKTIQAILRHGNLSTTMNTYVKTVDEDSKNAMKALDTLLCAKRAPDVTAVPNSLPN